MILHTKITMSYKSNKLIGTIMPLGNKQKKKEANKKYEAMGR